MRSQTKAVLVLLTVSILMINGWWMAETRGGQSPSSPPQILKVAWPSEPATLDLMATTSVDARTIALHIFETLYAYGSNGEIIPLLAEGDSVTADGKGYVIRLRRNVPFHNGRVMTSEDVVASIQRWFMVSGAGRTIEKDIAAVRALNKWTVAFELRNPTRMLLPYLAEPSQAALIMPKDLALAAGKQLLKPQQLVGTGPYKFDAWSPNESITLSKFDRYAKLPGEPNGFGGGKRARLDKIVFYFLSEQGVRLGGVQTGQYDYAEQVSIDDLGRISANRSLKTLILTPARFPGLVFHKQHGPGANVNVRRAIAAALDMEALLKSVAKEPRFYQLTGSIYPPGERWYTDVYKGKYNRRDKELARKLLREAGYAGEPLTFLIYTDKGEGELGMQLLVKQQLEAIGLVIKDVYVDYATIVSIRNKPSAYDMWIAPFTTRSDPYQMYLLTCDWPVAGLGWCDKDVMELFAQLAREPDFDRRYKTWVRINELLWDRVPVIIFGQAYDLGVMRTQVKGFEMLRERIFYNVWIEGR